MKINPNDSAFTISLANGFAPGLTKKELFSIMALQGLISGNNSTEPIHPDDTKRAVEYADKLIEELNKTK